MRALLCLGVFRCAPTFSPAGHPPMLASGGELCHWTTNAFSSTRSMSSGESTGPPPPPANACRIPGHSGESMEKWSRNRSKSMRTFSGTETGLAGVSSWQSLKNIRSVLPDIPLIHRAALGLSFGQINPCPCFEQNETLRLEHGQAVFLLDIFPHNPIIRVVHQNGGQAGDVFPARNRCHSRGSRPLQPVHGGDAPDQDVLPALLAEMIPKPGQTLHHVRCSILSASAACTRSSGSSFRLSHRERSSTAGPSAVNRGA